MRRIWSSLLIAAAVPRIASAQSSTTALDAIARNVIAREHVVGASVLVARDGKILFHKGYGFADLEVEAPTRPETVYHIVGPMLPFTGVAVMQLVEQGKLSLDDELERLIPEFPMQGHRVTIRQLLDHTSGIVDYHYLGDPIDATSRIPKALDEVMGLYAGKAWVNEPGDKWDWSISGFQLLVTIIERVSGQSFADYVREHIFEPAGVRSTTYCDDQSLVRGLAHSYHRFEESVVPARENDMAYNADLRICGTVGDFFRLWTAVRAGKLIRPETLVSMEHATGAAARMSPNDSLAQYGLALTLNHEEGHRREGQHGSLFGYSGSLYEFPKERLVVVVLTNTEGQNAYAISRALSRAVLGLPQLTSPPEKTPRSLTNDPVPDGERGRVAGTYILKLDRLSPGLHDSYAQYRRTYRVFDENGRLMIQALGQGPERLLKQTDGTFGFRSSPASRVSFAIQGNRATAIKIDGGGFGVPLSGARVGDGDPATFHQPRP